jgi:nucleotide-binding universal stress UspA family protein
MDTSRTPVVVAVDGTELSAGAIAYAVEEARSRHVGLTVVHVSPSYVPLVPLGPMVPMMGSVPPMLDEESHAILRRVCTRIEADAPELVIHPVLERGPVSSSILAAAEGAQLVVVGQETRSGLDRWAAGATTLKVAARADCPVVAVPVLWRPGPPRHRLLVGVRTASDAPGLLAQAFAMAAQRGDTLVVLHAWQLPDPYLDILESRGHLEEWTAIGEGVLDEVLAGPRAAFPDVTVERHVVHREPTRALVAAAEDVDMLLLARRTRELGHLTRLGATARAVLHHTPCPVTVLPAHAPVEPPAGVEPEESDRVPL